MYFNFLHRSCISFVVWRYNLNIVSHFSIDVACFPYPLVHRFQKFSIADYSNNTNLIGCFKGVCYNFLGEIFSNRAKSPPCNTMLMNISMVLGTFLHPVLDGRVAREASALNDSGHKVTIICWLVQYPESLFQRHKRSIKWHSYTPSFCSGFNTRTTTKSDFQHIQAKRQLSLV